MALSKYNNYWVTIPKTSVYLPYAILDDKGILLYIKEKDKYYTIKKDLNTIIKLSYSTDDRYIKIYEKADIIYHELNSNDVVNLNSNLISPICKYHVLTKEIEKI